MGTRIGPSRAQAARNRGFVAAIRCADRPASGAAGDHARLLELTEGEPLLLRLYVEDFWKQGEQAGRLTIEGLTRIRPGFGAYFRDWLSRQRDAWAHENARIDQRSLDAHLAVRLAPTALLPSMTWPSLPAVRTASRYRCTLKVSFTRSAVSSSGPDGLPRLATCLVIRSSARYLREEHLNP